jgi:hypothetical protein
LYFSQRVLFIKTRAPAAVEKTEAAVAAEEAAAQSIRREQDTDRTGGIYNENK